MVLDRSLVYFFSRFSVSHEFGRRLSMGMGGWPEYCIHLPPLRLHASDFAGSRLRPCSQLPVLHPPEFRPSDKFSPCLPVSLMNAHSKHSSFSSFIRQLNT